MSVLLLTSCENESTNQPTDFTVAKINQIYQTNSKTEQRKMLSMLDKNEKLFFWNQNIKKKLKRSDFNNKQIIIINKFIESLNENIFDEDSPENAYFKNITVPRYLTELKDNFTQNEIEDLFYRVDLQSRDIIYEGGDKDDCDCNRNSLVSCTALRPENCKKNENTCEELFSGCGFWYAYACNGICKPFG